VELYLASRTARTLMETGDTTGNDPTVATVRDSDPRSVMAPKRFLTTRPGTAKNDTLILPSTVPE